MVKHPFSDLLTALFLLKQRHSLVQGCDEVVGERIELGANAFLQIVFKRKRNSRMVLQALLLPLGMMIFLNGCAGVELGLEEALHKFGAELAGVRYLVGNAAEHVLFALLIDDRLEGIPLVLRHLFGECQTAIDHHEQILDGWKRERQMLALSARDRNHLFRHARALLLGIIGGKRCQGRRTACRGDMEQSYSPCKKKTVPCSASRCNAITFRTRLSAYGRLLLAVASAIVCGAHPMIKNMATGDLQLRPCSLAAALLLLALLWPLAGRAATPVVTAPSASLQVVHWWTSAGERRAVDVLINALAEQNIQWRDAAIAGGAGSGAGKVLKSMVLAGHAPEVTQLNGVIFGEWADLGLLLELDSVAAQGNWQKLLFPTVWSLLNNHGHVVAAPLGIHRINNLYYNQTIFRRLGLTAPKSWDEFDQVAARLRSAGITPLAQSSETWQVATLFETLVLSESGPSYYRQLLVDLSPAAFADTRLLHILKRLRSLKQAMAQPVREQAWTEVAHSLADGDAAMFIMGDWAKGEFNAWGLNVDQQFGCAAVPGTADYHLYSIDTLAMFAGDYSHQPAQEVLAQIAISPTVQADYSRFKGAISVWRAPDLSRMDRCSLNSWRVFSKGAAYQAPSLVHRMATDETTKDAISAEVRRFFVDDQVKPEQAQRRLAAIARALSHAEKTD